MEVKFDTSQIDKIKFKKKSHTSYFWLPARSAKPAFWPWNRIKAKDEGFYEYRDYSHSHYTVEEAKESHIVEMDGPEPRMFNKPHVEAVLRHVDNVGKTFDSEQLAREWVEKLVELSGKKFETIEY